MNSMSMGPMLHFMCCEVSSLTRSHAVWATMSVNKVFYKSMDGGLGRSIVCRGGKSISRVSLPIRTKHCHLHDGSGPTQ